jgi:hypothetical protein
MSHLDGLAELRGTPLDEDELQKASAPAPPPAPAPTNMVLDLQLTNSDLLVIAALLGTVLLLFVVKVNGLLRRVEVLEKLLSRM